MLQQDSITTIPFIGAQKARLLENLDIHSIKDLLYHIPVLYKDTSSITPINKIQGDGIHTIQGVIKEIKSIRLRNFKTLQKAVLEDHTGSINITWFNQPYLINTLKPGTLVLLSGKLNQRSLLPELISPEYDIFKNKNIHLGRIIPFYALTEKISAKWLRSRLDWTIERIDDIQDLEDTLPSNICEKYDLIALKKAIKLVHFPEKKEDITLSRKKLGIDELLEIFFTLYKEKQKRLNSESPAIKINNKNIDSFISSLNFSLFPSQINAIKEIMEDYKKKYPMERLLQGDVGSGKTIVAITAMLPVLESGYQVIFLAPTSILAEQHYESIKQTLGNKYETALITSSTKNYINTLGKVDILIGTHAILFHKEALIHKPGLLIVDEEHRFGVNQRRDLLNFKYTKYSIHSLHLTATPIPRSIALSLFGQMDLSSISRPSSREFVKTRVVPEEKKSDAIKWILKKLNNKSQVFWICPFIEESTIDENIKSVKSTFTEVKTLFPKHKTACLHGKLKQDLKNSTIKDFSLGKIKILVSTTVIEVGIDIPGADIIIIEGAERFGLAQLHQLRGRVGRRGQESWCLLFSSPNSAQSVYKRLNFFSKETSGNKIAEFDLQSRGPGEVYGTLQSGIPQLKVAKFSNLKLMEESRKIAFEIIQMKNELSN